MGFFSSVLAPVLAGAAGAILGPEAATAIGGLLGTTAAGVVGGPVLTPAQLTAAGGTAAQIIAATGGAACPAGTGGARKVTIIQTINQAGQVIKQITHKGGVAVFQSDVAAANRVARQVTSLNKRMPRKTVKESQTTALKNRLINNALEQAGDKACPK